MSKEHVKILKKAKKILWNGKTGGMIWCRYICWAIYIADVRGLNDETTAQDDIIFKIEDYLDGNDTLEGWLIDNHVIPYDYNNDKVMQWYRHAWLDQLIVEAEDW